MNFSGEKFDKHFRGFWAFPFEVLHTRLQMILVHCTEWHQYNYWMLNTLHRFSESTKWTIQDHFKILLVTMDTYIWVLLTEQYKRNQQKKDEHINPNWCSSMTALNFVGCEIFDSAIPPSILSIINIKRPCSYPAPQTTFLKHWKTNITTIYPVTLLLNCDCYISSKLSTFH